ncbi:MAG: pitrilysin family protein, partial [Mariprofundaceae bacterium]
MLVADIGNTQMVFGLYEGEKLVSNWRLASTRERLCLHMQVLREDWPEALRLLAAMINEADLPTTEWALEREVIRSEIAMVEDAPEEWAMDRHLAGLFPGHALGRPVLGDPASLARIGRDELAGWMEAICRPPRLLVAAAGRIDHEALTAALAEIEWRQPAGAPSRHAPRSLAQGIQRLPRDDEQVQFLFSVPGVRAADETRPQAWLANQALGGGMSSRLFREVREKRGLAYGVGSQLSALSDTGLWTVSCATTPERAPEAARVLAAVIGEAAEGLDEAELARARRQIEVQLRMGRDSVEARMLRLGGRLDEARLASTEEWVARLREVDAAEVRAWMRARLRQPGFWTVVAPEAALDGICDRIRPCLG